MLRVDTEFDLNYEDPFYFLSVIDFWGELLMYKTTRPTGTIRYSLEIVINTKWKHRRKFLNKIVKGYEYKAQGDTIQLRYRSKKQLREIYNIYVMYGGKLLHEPFFADILKEYLFGDKKFAYEIYLKFKKKYGERK